MHVDPHVVLFGGRRCSGFGGTVDGMSLGASAGSCQNKWNNVYMEMEDCVFTFAAPQTGTVFRWWCNVAAAHLNGGALQGKTWLAYVGRDSF